MPAAPPARTRGRSTAQQRLDAGSLTPGRMRAVANALAMRHARSPAAPDFAPQPDFFRTLLDDPSVRRAARRRLVERIEGGLVENADRLIERAGRGRILKQAAELRLEDVFIDDDDEVSVEAPSSREIGVAFDAGLEVASLSVRLAAAGHPELAERLVSHYANQAEDFDLYSVLDFFESFCVLRQSVRAVGRGAEAPAEPPLVEPAARSPLSRPVVVAMSGAVASGKSTLARALADELAVPLVVADRIRDHLVHGVPGRPLHEAGWAQGFEPGFGPRVYAAMFLRGEKVLASGRPLILDACFPTPFERAGAIALARRHGVPFRFVSCHVDPDVHRARLAERNAELEDDPGAWNEIADDLAARFVAPSEIEPEERLYVDTSYAPEASLAQLLDRFAGPLLPDREAPSA